ncbi:4-(cytidine 5'-diphospho)-2-C-methyl-D-erythritol kinase [Luteimicrobium subarcticum]|uniref:4-diphosphocytidyl-2-C-methyl-D-erythritol kinase n=1 Tax=Luteimicrobium subarcticum TaxID=620910 RepID=A0A2M8WSZ0_9MICO|nr:4-(cytidine 5'-diphospho)-2-C-methyl-D-erythritol kinase [Luteimicrobium subarcticum]PJI94072.1 4-diphosphocytidyl-2-C-methyl-D-erythritol kinase [Luteimicrobium subarcticum]
MNAHLSAAPDLAVTVRAPGKVNLSLRVGPVQPDGYHPLVNIFQALSVHEDVTASAAPVGAGISIQVRGQHAERVPVDDTNLAWRAAELVAERAGVDPDVRLRLDKGVPVAGGMAGGSADAAAALLACSTLWDAGLDRDDLLDLGGRLGADVPFALLGHTAVGTGRGDLLTPALVRGEYCWALAVNDDGLSTARVFRAFDDRVAERGEVPPEPELDDEAPLMQALRAGDPARLGELLHNDLQEPALALAPHLRLTMEVARDAGALGVVVSGSGPTVAALARSRQHALAIAASWTASGTADAVLTATGNAPGARVV